MTTIAQLMAMVPTIRMNAQEPVQPKAKAKDSGSFEELVSQKKQETAPAAKTEPKQSAEAPKEQPQASESEEDIPEEQSALAVGLMMEVRPEIQFVELEPEAETVGPQLLNVQETETELTVEQPTTGMAEAAPTAETSGIETVTQPQQELPVQQAEAAETTEAAPQMQAKRSQVTEVRAERPEDEQEPAEELAQTQTEAPVFGEVKATPVKVAQPVREAVELEAPNGMEKLAQQVQIAVDLEQGKVEITLSPENLGKLTVEIARGDNGALSILMHAANPKTAALLERHAGGLENLLAAGTRTEVRVQVQESQGADKQYLNPNGDENAKHQGRQQQPKEKREQSSEDFLQKLRLGLVELNAIA